MLVKRGVPSLPHPCSLRKPCVLPPAHCPLSLVVAIYTPGQSSYCRRTLQTVPATHGAPRGTSRCLSEGASRCCIHKTPQRVEEGLQVAPDGKNEGLGHDTPKGCAGNYEHFAFIHCRQHAMIRGTTSNKMITTPENDARRYLQYINVTTTMLRGKGMQVTTGCTLGVALCRNHISDIRTGIRNSIYE